MSRFRYWYRLFRAIVSLPLFLWPGLLLVRDLADPALRGPGIPRRARELHATLTPRIATW
ncbi:MAG: hypothetical protein JWM10_2887, partial [Myxococcaceae bacterium]|nr:hypothetical protein [Myxococcaceae bacterium]